MDGTALERLTEDLAAAQAAGGTLTGSPPAGVRAVEPAAGRRWYLCAFPGPAFLCLNGDLAAETSAAAVRQIASCVLLVEHGEGLVDGPELAMLSTLAERVRRSVVTPPLAAALAELAVASDAARRWREAPERALASLAALDDGVVLHDRVRGAYDRFVEHSEPLVADQDRLAGELVEALRDLELVAGRLGVGRPLAGALAEAIPAIDQGADEIVTLHVTPLGEDG